MVRLIDVSKTYENGTEALVDVNLTIEKGEFVFLIGSSGSGKSTIVKTLTSEINVEKGRVEVNGFDLNNIEKKEIPLFRRSIGIVFQDFRLIKRKTVYENVEFAIRAVGKKMSIGKMRERVKFVLKMVKLEEKARAYPSQLSGGEQQRVAIARAIVNNPELIIADEPTGNLDPKMSKEIMTILDKINEKLNTTILVVTHEKELVNQFNKRVLTISDGKIVSDRKGGYDLGGESIENV